jgi:hypothetical protein
MPTERAPAATERSERKQSFLWALAVLFFGVGDVATTSVGLGIGGLFELGPVTSLLVEGYGLGGMVVSKLLVFAGSLCCWWLTRGPHRLGIPLGLTLVGVSVTGWNLYLLALVTSG